MVFEHISFFCTFISSSSFLSFVAFVNLCRLRAFVYGARVRVNMNLEQGMSALSNGALLLP